MSETKSNELEILQSLEKDAEAFCKERPYDKSAVLLSLSVLKLCRCLNDIELEISSELEKIGYDISDISKK
jgi:hypothetical protein